MTIETLESRQLLSIGPFSPLAPLGSGAYVKTIEGSVDPVERTEAFELDLGGGQPLNFVLTVPENSMTGLNVFGPSGFCTDGIEKWDEATLIGHVRWFVEGTHTFVITNYSREPMPYSLTLFFNADFEEEEYGGPANDDLASYAGTLYGDFELGNDASSRRMVIGALPADIKGRDWYEAVLDQRLPSTIAVTANEGANVRLRLFDSSGNQVAEGEAVNGTTSVIRNFRDTSAPVGSQGYRVLVSGTGGAYTLTAAVNADLEDATGVQNIDGCGHVMGYLGSTQTGQEFDDDGRPYDCFVLSGSPGQTIVVATRTPRDSPGELANTLDPSIELCDPSGNLVASDNNRAEDGRNAGLSYLVETEGTYTVIVRGARGTWGEYLLSAEALSPGEISGTKWHDRNGDGRRNPGEPGRPDVTMYLDLNGNRQLDEGEPVAVTERDDPNTADDESGRYCFAQVVPGAYTVAEVLPPGWEQTFPYRGVPGPDRCSVSENGVEGNGNSGRSSVSADGDRVIFYSNASNVAEGDGDTLEDAFILDRRTRQLEWLSENTTRTYYGGSVSVSDDGRQVAFSTADANLVEGDTNGTSDVFVRDRLTGAVERVSVAADGSELNGASWVRAISDNGQAILFTSEATNLGSVAPQPNALPLYLVDRESGTLRQLVDGPTAMDAGELTWVSADAHYLVFSGIGGIRVYDTTTDKVQRIGKASDGSGTGILAFSACISADGRYVTFASSSADLVEGEPPERSDVFRFDRESGSFERLRLLHEPGEWDNPVPSPTCSADGRYIAFASTANNLVAGDTNSVHDIFVHDWETGSTRRVSVGYSGSQSNGRSFSPSISADGKWVSFSSEASNLVPGDTNGVSDTFVVPALGGWTDTHLVEVTSGSACDRVDFGGRPIQSPTLGDGTLVVPDTIQQTAVLHVDSEDLHTNTEVWAYEIDDADGTVAGFAPSEPGYRQAVVETADWWEVYRLDGGPTQEVSLPSGKRVAFVVVETTGYEPQSVASDFADPDHFPPRPAGLAETWRFSVDSANSGETSRIIANNTPDGRCRLSWQSSLAGQTMAVHLGVRSDLAPVTYPTTEPDSVSTAHWLGTVDDLALHNLETKGEERWYRFRTAHRGTLTLAVSHVATAANAQVALFGELAEAGPLAVLVPGDGPQRVDVETEAAGRVYYLRVSGNVTGLDLRLLNLVHESTDTLRVHGTDAADTLVLQVEGSPGLEVNGFSYAWNTMTVSRFRLDGGEGEDHIEVIGTSGDETLTLSPGSGELNGDHYFVTMTSLERARCLGNGGHDVAVLNDSRGDDTLESHPGEATLSGDGFTSHVTEFDSVLVYARSGGHDKAVLHDSASDDKFKGTPTWSLLRGGGFYQRAKFFDEVVGTSTHGGKDQSVLWDSSDDDELTASPQYAELSGELFLVRAEAFSSVVALASKGHDRVAFYDSRGDDVFRGLAHKSQLDNSACTITARKFDTVVAHATEGFDKLRLGDSAGDDHLILTSGMSRIQGTGIDITGYGFDKINAAASIGGLDTAEIHDTAGSDFLEAEAGWVRIYLDEQRLSLLYETLAFERVQAHHSEGNDGAQVAADVAFLELIGDWERS